LKDIENYEEVIQKSLSAFKHYTLTVVESRALKTEIKRLSSMVSERRDELLLEALKNVPINYSEAEAASCSKVSEDGGASEQMTEEATVTTVQLTPQIIARFMKDNLTKEEMKRKWKVLEEMRLPTGEVVMSGLQIGKGGFGEVFLGNFKNRHRIAMKTVKYQDEDGKPNTTAIRSIENELLLMKYMGNYPTILNCFGFVSDESSFQVVLELAPYGSLDVILRDTRNYPTLPLPLMVAWLCDLADAVKYIHGREIKHRDLKAENLLVFERFRVKLCDFGPAKQQVTVAETCESRVGTFSFMAPEIRVGGPSEFASDIFSFGMTAVQMLTRRTPKIDDFRGQVLSALFSAEIPAEVNDLLSGLLVSCVSYDANRSQNELRPNAAILASDLCAVLEKLGGDPRECNGNNMDMYEIVNDMENIARRLEAEKLTGKTMSVSHPSMMIRKSASYSSFIRVPSSTSLTSYGAGDHHHPPLLHGSSSMLLSPSMDATQQDEEDKATLTRFFVDHFRYPPMNSNNYAEILVRNGVSSTDALRRRLTRNKDYLVNIGIEDRIAREVCQVVLNNQSTGKFFGMKSHSSSQHQIANNPFSQSNSNMSSSHYSASGGETDEIGSSSSGGGGPGYPASVQQSQDMEDRSSLIRFFGEAIRCDQIVSMRSADMLMRNGVPTVEVLHRRISRDPEFLLNIGFEENLAADITDYFGGAGNAGGMASRSFYSPARNNTSNNNLNNRSSYSISPMSPSSPANGLPRSMSAMSMRTTNNNLNRQNTISMILRSDHLPTEISRLYYDATQCNNRDALLKLMHLADNGDSLAQGFVMRMYCLGQGGLQKDVLAAGDLGTRLMPWLNLAVENTHDMTCMYARYILGVCYSEGLGCKKDIREGLRWYRLSAEQGYSAAQAYMGFAYYSGMGVVQNLQEAVRWYSLSADQGYAAAQCNLGLCYEHGYGAVKNPDNAVKWYKAGAEQGDAASLYNLGHCYEHGLGKTVGAVNLEKAFEYYLQSAEIGYTSGQYKVGYCYYTGEGTPQNLDCAVAWFRAAANKGYAPAQCKLGLCYENGHGVEKHFEKAAEWYRKSADQSHPPALYYLGYMYYAGNGLPRNIDEAVRLYKESAEKGYPAAQNNLGFCYFNGVGMAKNLQAAVHWYKKAAEQDYAAAQYNLGYCYEKGFGVSTKIHELLKWYRLAAANGNDKAKQALLRFNV
jgi:TPR repeat protein/serine/threonine protein kinase